MAVAIAAALVVGLAPGTGSTSPTSPASALDDVPPAPASAHRVWYSDLGSGVDGMAVEPGTGRIFVREATADGADLMVGGPFKYIEPDRMVGPFGYPVAADGSVFVWRDGQLRRFDPTTLSQTGAWTVPGLTADQTLATVDGDIVWVERPVEQGVVTGERVYRFDPATGTTTSSTETDLGYAGPVGGGDELVGWSQYPARLVRFTGAQPGAYVALGSGQHEANSVDVSDDGALATVVDFPEARAVEYSLPDLAPTGVVYETDDHPMLSASTTVDGGALAVVSTGGTSQDFSLQVFARGNPHAVVDVELPPMSRVPQPGDLEFSGDGKKLFLLVRDRPASGVPARVVVADLATTVYETADPIVVGSKGGAVTAVMASLGTGTSVTVGGAPVAASVEVGQELTLGETHDRISFAVPAMDPGTKLIWLTNALGHQTSGGPVHVVDLGPFVNAPWFVSKQIKDVTGKKATPQQIDAGLEQLVAEPDAGSFIARLEAQRGQMTQRAALIRLYRAVFLRIPDTGGLRYWLDRMAKGTRLTQVAATFAGSKEFKTRYGSLSDAEFVERIYQNVLGRPADPGGRAYWTKKLGAGTSRGVLVAQFAQSNEYVTRSQIEVQRIELHLAMLGRTPTYLELSSLGFLPLEDVAWTFLTHPAYSTSG